MRRHREGEGTSLVDEMRSVCHCIVDAELEFGFFWTTAFWECVYICLPLLGFGSESNRSSAIRGETAFKKSFDVYQLLSERLELTFSRKRMMAWERAVPPSSFMGANDGHLPSLRRLDESPNLKQLSQGAKSKLCGGPKDCAKGAR